MSEELCAPLCLVGLADDLGLSTQTIERSQEALICQMLSTDIAVASPSVCPQRVETPVIAHSERCVGLDVVACDLSETRPRVAGARICSTDRGDSVPLLIRG